LSLKAMSLLFNFHFQIKPWIRVSRTFINQIAMRKRKEKCGRGHIFFSFISEDWKLSHRMTFTSSFDICIVSVNRNELWQQIINFISISDVLFFCVLQNSHFKCRRKWFYFRLCKTESRWHLSMSIIWEGSITRERNVMNIKWYRHSSN